MSPYAEELRAARVRQGLPPTITDPKVLNLLAALLAKPIRADVDERAPGRQPAD